MDSPVFCSSKAHYEISKLNNNFEYSSNIQTRQWDISSNNFQSYQILGQQLKLQYSLLGLEKNIKYFCHKLKKILNRKVYDAFEKIFFKAKNKYTNQNLYQVQNLIFNEDNPENTFKIVCLGKVEEALKNLNNILKRVQMRKKLKALNRLLVFNSLCEANIQQVDIDFNSSLTKQLEQYSLNKSNNNSKRVNSKKNSQQMKQNSILMDNSNFNLNEINLENQKIMSQISSEQFQLEKFTEEMNNLLSYHESILNISQKSTKNTENKGNTGYSKRK